MRRGQVIGVGPPNVNLDVGSRIRIGPYGVWAFNALPTSSIKEESVSQHHLGARRLLALVLALAIGATLAAVGTSTAQASNPRAVRRRRRQR